MSDEKEVWLDLVAADGQQVLVRVARRTAIARFYNHLSQNPDNGPYEFNRDQLLRGIGWEPSRVTPEFNALIRAAQEELRRQE